MEITEFKKSCHSISSQSSDGASSGQIDNVPNVRVIFHIGSEENENEPESSDKTINSVNPDETSFEPLETIRENCFKRKVDELMQDKRIWEELTKDSPKKTEDINKDFASVAKHLLKKSSIYAVSQVGHAESPYRKILWLLVLAAGLFGCCYEIHNFLVLYFQYPVVINLHVESKFSMEFPAVTICNLNRMKRQYEICMERNIPADDCNLRVTGLGKHKLSISERRKVASCSVQLSGIKDKALDNRIKFLTKYTKVDDDRRKAYGHQLHEFVLNCTFNGEECSSDYFTEFQSLKYGNCFAFNKRSNDSVAILKTSSVGVVHGLELTLNLDPRNYLSITPSIGARVIIHDPNADPNPEEKGVNISPGFETTLAMKQTSISRLPAPYKDRCVSYGENFAVRGKNQDECIRSCLQEQNYANCSCIDPTLPALKDYKMCNMDNATDACCLDHLLEFMATHGLPCECPLSCFSTEYNLRMSTAIWPSRNNYFDPLCDKCKDKDALKSIRDTQARLRVYYSSLEHTIYEQKAMFQDSELFSHLGGQLGLWLGLSLVAAFELIENLIYIGKYCATFACPSKSDK